MKNIPKTSLLQWLAVASLLLVGCKPTESQEAEAKSAVSEENLSKLKIELYDLKEGLQKVLEDDLCSGFDCDAEKDMQTLADSTKGKLSKAHNSSEVVAEILTVLDSNLVDSSDVLFLIDKTGSMYDDIESIQASSRGIINKIRGHKGVRLGVALYGDKHADGETWYESRDFTENYDQVVSSIDSVLVSGGGDYPESVNDALVRSMQTLAWKSSRLKTIIVLGDAPSLTGSLTQYELTDVIRIALEKKVITNVFPILLSPL